MVEGHPDAAVDLYAILQHVHAVDAEVGLAGARVLARSVASALHMEGGRICDAMPDLDPGLHVGSTVLELLVRRQRSAEGVPVEHPLHGDLEGLFHSAD